MLSVRAFGLTLGIFGAATMFFIAWWLILTGNALVKMMIYFMGACAAGVVLGGKTPVVITSRSDESEARLASIAAAVVALN